jgi:hypothetical protein
MAIGKSKISDLDFNEMESEVDKNMERDEMAGTFEHQMKVMAVAKESVDTSIHELNVTTGMVNTSCLKVEGALTQANNVADRIGDKVEELNKVRIKTEVDPAEWLRLTNLGKTYLEGVENKMKSKNDELRQSMTNFYYEMSNRLSNAEGIWISGTWSKVIMYVGFGCFLYTVVTLLFFVAMVFGK